MCVRKPKAEKWLDEEKEKLWCFHLDNKQLSCIQLAKTVKGFFPIRTEGAITAMIYILKQESLLTLGPAWQENKVIEHIVDTEIVYETGRPSVIKKHNLSEKEVRLIVLEWYTNSMFPDILQDEDGRDLEKILDVESEKSRALLEKALNLITALEGHADGQTKKDIESLFQEVKYSDYIDEEMARYVADNQVQDYGVFGKNKI